MRRFDPTDKSCEGRRTWIGSISRFVSDYNNITLMYALTLMAVILIGLITLSTITYEPSQLYPKEINPENPINPYYRGGKPFIAAHVISQYPENTPALGYVTSYLTPLSRWFSEISLNLGTVIAAHPGGIIDEILYYTRGIDTIVETSILFVAFAAASFLFRRREAP